MLKKLSVLLSMVLVFCTINASNTFASEFSTITYLENGYYIISEPTHEDISYSEILPLSTITTKNVSKSSKLYDTSDRLLVTLTIYASFSINSDVSVTCTKATYGKTITSNNWSFVSGTTSINDSSTLKASATASGTFKNVYTGLNIPIKVTVSCTNRGAIS